MRMRQFGHRQVSVLALGSSEFGGTCPAEKAFDFMDAYVELGGNFIDTAHVYGDFATPKNGESEKVIGRWMEQRHNRDHIFLSTKGAHPILGQMNVEDPTLVPMDAEGYKLHCETNLICAPFSSQAKGFFSKLFDFGADGLPDKAKRRYLSEENLAVYDRILKVREEIGLSVGAIALAWLTCQPFPVFPLVGASRIEQVHALKEAGDAVITDRQRDFLKKGA